MQRLSTVIFSLIGCTIAAQDLPDPLPAARGVVLATEAASSFHVPAPALRPAEDRTAEFIVNYSGFSTEAQTAFQYAVDIWSGLITSDVPIVIDAQWEDLPGNTLGSAGATGLWYNFSGAPFNGILYPSPLADKLAGFNLDPGQADISANFDSGTNWYYGLDGNPPFSAFDLVSVVLHEIGHGLGFAGTVYVGADGNGYVLNGSLPGVFDGHVWTGNSESILSFEDGSAALGAALVSENLYWGGIQGNAYSGSPLSPKMYAPLIWEPGSSFSHFDEDLYPAGSDHSLMTPAIGNGEAVHSPGAMALGVLDDIGWTVDYAALGVGIPGCTDESACNYDPEATLVDGSCIYPVADEPCGDCISVWSMASDLAAGEGEAFTYGGVGTMGQVDISVQWPGQSGGGEWISDLLVEICDPNGDCFEWGGYDLTSGSPNAGVDWPEEWDVSSGGTFTVSLDLTLLDLSGVGTWTVTLYNGYQSSSGLTLSDVTFTVPFVCSLTGLNPGCTDSAACNFDAAADYNDGSCDYLCFNCAETTVNETFQGYDTDQPLTVQSSAGWETWSGGSGTAEDPYVVFDGFDGAAAIVAADVDPTQGTDLILPIGETEGTHVVQFALKADAGSSVYYNFQGDVVPGVEWTFENYIFPDGTLRMYHGTDSTIATGFQWGQDNFLTHLFDLDNNELRVVMGSSLIALIPYPGNLGGVNFYGVSFGGGTGEYLLDDVTVCSTTTSVVGCTDASACNYNPDAEVDDGSCWTPFDYGWCNCEGDVFDALGECGGDCAADLDDDGICDSEDPCVGGELDECGMCDGPGPIYECGCTDIPNGDCDCDGNQLDALGVCGGDCTADLDMDGVCDIPGCTDVLACNYESSANYDDGSCAYAEAYYDCQGNCLNDTDGDGVCDELEAAGCTDGEACNFDADATEDDGSCAFLMATGIDGAPVVNEGDVTLYVAQPSEPGNTYTWAVSGGSLESGQGTPIVTVAWSDVGSQGIQLVESNSECTGGVLSLDVAVQEVVGMDEAGRERITVFPNPAVQGFHISSPVAGVLLMALDGRRVQTWPAAAPGGWYPLQNVGSGVYLLQFETGGRPRTQRLLIGEL